MSARWSQLGASFSMCEQASLAGAQGLVGPMAFHQSRTISHSLRWLRPEGPAGATLRNGALTASFCSGLRRFNPWTATPSYSRKEVVKMMRKYFVYLDELRESGETNMFGAPS